MAIKPVCFMVMPFGIKPTGVEGGKGPGQIDCSALWEKALRPMIEDLGYLPVRADQDLGALIIQEMIERLAIADLVIADLTIPNGNVYYELGVRHAARKQGCVIIAAEWSKQLFDTDQMRRVSYPLSEGSVTDNTAERIRLALRDEVRRRRDAISPVFQALPGYPNGIDPARVGSFRDVAEKLAAFQAEVSVTRRLPRDQASAEATRLLEKYRADASALPTIAVELLALLRDARAWRTALDFAEGLPDRIKDLPLVREQRALFLGKTGRDREAIEALEALIATEGETSERRGLLGGRYKVLHDNAQDGNAKRQYLNHAIEQYERGMQLDLNDYYPSCNLPRLYRARRDKQDETKAASAAAVAMLACRRSRARNPEDSWAPPTLLGAAFDAGDVRSARKLRDEIDRIGTAAFHLSSTIPDLRRSLNLLRVSKKASALAAVLGDLQRMLDAKGVVIALAGRRVDAQDAQVSRFPAANVALVAHRIRNMLVGLAGTALVCSAACGADILALEAAGELGIRRRVLLPFRPDLFRDLSVTDRGGEWGNRFDRVMSAVEAAGDLLELSCDKDAPHPYIETNGAILNEAVRLASAAQQRPVATVVWNEISRGEDDVTEAFLKEAQRRELEIITVPTL